MKVAPQIEVADVCARLVGISPVYLQNLLSRGLFGLRSSISPGKVRSKQRLFSPEDVYGIALVWLLFEAGLRHDAIERILMQVAEMKKPDANKAASRLIDTEYLFIARTSRGPSKSIAAEPSQDCELLEEESLANKFPIHADKEFFTPNMLIVPVGEKFADVRQRLEILFEVK